LTGCATCQAPIEDDTRRHKTHYRDITNRRVVIVGFSVCQMCDSLMKMNRAERVDREFKVARDYMLRAVLGGEG